TQIADLGAAAEIPALFRHEVDSGGAREAGLSAALVTLLEVNAGTVGESSLHARDQVALAYLRAVVRPLIFQCIVQVEIGQVGIEKTGADLSAATEVPIGSFPVDPEAFRQPIGATRTDAAVA